MNRVLSFCFLGCGLYLAGISIGEATSGDILNALRDLGGSCGFVFMSNKFWDGAP